MPVVSRALPVKTWAPAPSMRRVPLPPSKVEAWLRSPWAATVPVVIVPSVRVRVPPTVRVVPAATVWVSALRKTTSWSAWLPLMVWVPANTTVLVPGSMLPAR